VKLITVLTVMLKVVPLVLSVGVLTLTELLVLLVNQVVLYVLPNVKDLAHYVSKMENCHQDVVVLMMKPGMPLPVLVMVKNNLNLLNQKMLLIQVQPQLQMLLLTS